MEEALISVIVPVYNSENTIEKCLESICRQSYRNLEIIIIDDGSTDHTAEILEAWRLCDSRIRVMHQKNKGAAAARNYGLDILSGEWFSFVDADDEIEPLIYEKLYFSAVKMHSDIISASIKEIYKDNRIENHINEIDGETITGFQALDFMLRYSGGIRTVVWDKLYRTERMKNIRFQEEYKYGEDTVFNFMALLKCKNYTKISYVGYIYDHRASMMTGNGRFIHSSMSNLHGIITMKNILQESNVDACMGEKIEEALQYFSVMICRQMFHNVLLMGDYREKDQADYNEIKETASMINKGYVRRHLSFRDYIQWKLYINNPQLFLYANKINHMWR